MVKKSSSLILAPPGAQYKAWRYQWDTPVWWDKHKLFVLSVTRGSATVSDGIRRSLDTVTGTLDTCQDDSIHKAQSENIYSSSRGGGLRSQLQVSRVVGTQPPYLKLWPVHSHAWPMVSSEPPQVLYSISCFDALLQLPVNGFVAKSEIE